MKTRLKPFLKIFIPIFIISSTVISALAWYEVKTELKTMEYREYSNVLLKVKSIENHLNPIVADLSFMVTHHFLQDFLDNNSELSKQNLQKEFLLGSTVKTYYDQIRFIDLDGMEIVRINYNNGNPEIVHEDKLQNKKGRYYFKETICLEREQVYASPFDLNVEGGEIEMPVKPMIRIGMPVFNHLLEKKGIVIINYRGELLLKEFAENAMLNDTVILSEGNFWLINSEGFWLKGPEHEKEWSFMYEDKKDVSFSNEYSKEWKEIHSKEHGQITSKTGLFTYSTIFPFSRKLDNKRENSNTINSYNWKVISFIPKSIIKSKIINLLGKYILFLSLINLLSVVGILIIISARVKIKSAEKNLRFLQEKRNSLQSLLLKIHQSEFPDLLTGLEKLVSVSHEFLQVDYISIWRMNKENSFITCMDIPADPQIYPFTDMVIGSKMYKEYFKAVISGEQIVADNTFTHKATKGFREKFLLPEEVVSSLDSPIWNHGKVVGIFALAQRKKIRKWSGDDQNFARQIASSIATMIETDERIKAEQKMKEAVKKAESANKIKSEFLANMSHEIRTPMNAILGFSEILLGKKQNDEDREYLQSINSSGKTLLHLINDILDLSKIEADKVEIINTKVNIVLILEDMKRIFSQKINEKNIKYITQIPENIPKFILLDEIRLRQILLNVIGNALKFTDTGFVKISISSLSSPDKPENTTLIINIEDSGIGIQEDSREKVFNPFEQTGKGSLAKYGGTGLGLAITKRLLELMNGSIEIVHKDTPGTIFRITFFDINTILSASTGIVNNG